MRLKLCLSLFLSIGLVWSAPDDRQFQGRFRREENNTLQGCPDWMDCHRPAARRCTRDASEKNWNNEVKADWISNCIPRAIRQCINRKNETRFRRDLSLMDVMSSSVNDKLTAVAHRLTRREAIVELLNGDNLIDQIESVRDTLSVLSGSNVRMLSMEDVNNLRMLQKAYNEVLEVLTDIQKNNGCQCQFDRSCSH